LTVNAYPPGNRVRLQATFTVAGVNTDPTIVTLNVKDPTGTVTPYTYALGGVIKSATGIYYKDVDMDAEGVWEYGFLGTAPAKGGRSGEVLILHSDVL
jgi:hypothetical protein